MFKRCLNSLSIRVYSDKHLWVAEKQGLLFKMENKACVQQIRYSMLFLEVRRRIICRRSQCRCGCGGQRFTRSFGEIEHYVVLQAPGALARWYIMSCYKHPEGRIIKVLFFRGQVVLSCDSHSPTACWKSYMRHLKVGMVFSS